uniref:Uncharacterized protein n=2 Tax=Anguilla anguilla TaxID=7936 RepID=A0A0E9XQN3_ANGAN
MYTVLLTIGKTSPKLLGVYCHLCRPSNKCSSKINSINMKLLMKFCSLKLTQTSHIWFNGALNSTTNLLQSAYPTETQQKKSKFFFSPKTLFLLNVPCSVLFSIVEYMVLDIKTKDPTR